MSRERSLLDTYKENTRPRLRRRRASLLQGLDDARGLLRRADSWLRRMARKGRGCLRYRYRLLAARFGRRPQGGAPVVSEVRLGETTHVYGSPAGVPLDRR